MDAADFLIGSGYSREAVLGMTPREIMFAIQPAEARKRSEKADALKIATIAAHDPKLADKEIKALL